MMIMMSLPTDDGVRSVLDDGRQPPEGWKDGLVVLLRQPNVPGRGKRCGYCGGVDGGVGAVVGGLDGGGGGGVSGGGVTDCGGDVDVDFAVGGVGLAVGDVVGLCL